MNKAWLTPCEVAEYLSISKTTVYRMVDDGELLGIKIRGSLRIKTTSLENLINEQMQIQAIKNGI